MTIKKLKIVTLGTELVTEHNDHNVLFPLGQAYSFRSTFYLKLPSNDFKAQASTPSEL